MTNETFLDGRVTMLLGDVRAMLKTLPDDHFDCVVTSPPYWGLRDYGTGRWEGGDLSCDHRSPTMREGRNEDRKKLAGSAATNSAQLLLAHRSACGKCGAIKVDEQIGLEPTLSEHLSVMVEVFDEVRRVLKPTGTVWLNYGDCYATTPNGRSAAQYKADGKDDRTFRDKPFSTVGPITTGAPPRSGRSANLGNTGSDGVRRNYAGEGYLKPKDLCMIPNRLAIALQDAGWWVRSEIVWGKTNPMPDSSGNYRPSSAHEKIFMLTKSDDGDVWRARDTGEISYNPNSDERCALVTDKDREGARWMRMGNYYDAEGSKKSRTGDEDAVTFCGGSYVGGQPGKRAVTGNKCVKIPDGWDTSDGNHGTRHRRGRPDGKLIEVTPRHQHHINHTGLDELGRGEGRLLRNYEPAPLTVWPMATKSFGEAHFATFPPELAERCIKAGCPTGGAVLDPFAGAGTTALVAVTMDRKATLIELNPDYAKLARARIESAFMGKDEGARHMVKQLGKNPDPFQPGSLFAGLNSSSDPSLTEDVA
jgi:DNA modification methylase